MGVIFWGIVGNFGIADASADDSPRGVVIGHISTTSAKAVGIYAIVNEQTDTSHRLIVLTTANEDKVTR
jgi:hypothetical protein